MKLLVTLLVTLALIGCSESEKPQGPTDEPEPPQQSEQQEFEPTPTSDNEPEQPAESTGPPELTDDEIRDRMISQSISSYSGNCPCPYFRDSAGRRCGARSAWSRGGGAAPLCYRGDISDEAVTNYRAANQ